LAYAAQGVSGDATSQSGGQIREFLTRAATALLGIGDLFKTLIKEKGLDPAEKYLAYASVLDRDARDSLAAIELVLAQTAISSQLVDNLNASIHLRALLRDSLLTDARVT